MKTTELERRILTLATFAPDADRGTLATDLGVPLPTVASAVRRLLDADALVETDEGRSRDGIGRPARMVRVPGPTTAVGLVRWTGTGVTASCLDVRGVVLAESHLAAPDPATGVEGLRGVVDRVVTIAKRRRTHQLRAIVLAVPAPYLSGHGAPREHASLDTASAPFVVTAVGDVEATLSAQYGLPVIMENDANLAAVGELYRGAAVGAANALCVTVTDHGFGSALIVNGRLARGARGYAGELAHLQVDRDGPLCACGGRGCLLFRVREHAVEAAQSAYDEPITFADLVRLAVDGDAGAARMMRDVGRVLGGPLAHLCTFLDPELLLIGGNTGAAAEHVVAGIRDVLAVQAPPSIADNLVVAISELGPDAELRGAVELPRLHARRR